MTLRLLALLLALLSFSSEAAGRPWVIAHRGSSGDYPGLTMLAFTKAAEEGADMLELDTAVTKDHQVIVLHEPDLSPTTNVKDVPEFAGRLKTDTIFSDDNYTKNVTDYFTWDFSLDEIKKLRKHQRISFRDSSFDGKEQVPSLREAIQLVKRLDSERQPDQRRVALLIEVKLCRYFTARTNRSKEVLIAADLTAEGVDNRPDIIHLQTFELQCAAELKRLLPNLPVYKLEESAGISDEKLTQWRRDLKLDGIGVHKAMVAGGSANPASPEFTYKYRVTGPTDLVQRAKRQGENFKVLVWTLRNEDRYIAWTFSQDGWAEADFFATEAKVDGLITDFPKTVRRLVDDRFASSGSKIGSPSGGLPALLALAAAAAASWSSYLAV
ncbi:hypothetical protein BOX15_Mlig008292g1 [Macrostomum lignano]|uniref:glycerophosphodiester phosphodiesterase n=1 Tax=Macrostomum lignano TaxID=282301 RepID=A0A267F6X2_9PLAT|nr:hypothetical protein BOX15_Mlig008292g1 [Macrostomum lignano]